MELLRCRRLVKGYSDTHAGGSHRFDRLLAADADLLGRSDAAQRVAALRELPLADASGKAFDEGLKGLG